MSLGNDIKLLRQRCLLSQQDFAKELGVSFATINRIESGKSKPTYKTMKLIISVLWNGIAKRRI